jgi:hypothetical protein
MADKKDKTDPVEKPVVETRDPNAKPWEAPGDVPRIPSELATRDKDGLRTDGPTLEQYVDAGYDAKDYPPEGYAKVASVVIQDPEELTQHHLTPEGGATTMGPGKRHPHPKVPTKK